MSKVPYADSKVGSWSLRQQDPRLEPAPPSLRLFRKLTEYFTFYSGWNPLHQNPGRQANSRATPISELGKPRPRKG